ncbi:hypothetical protein [Microvirga solisilvae]|uniref:hypothetical protein n=1 Tax=Microvirga solisilvae TaxID=2919498 RepID=UPI001FAED857|nr:hypothetical protein [Microvirga solisilvae]
MLDTKHIINGYSLMVMERLEAGWDGYLLTFMYKPIKGSQQSVNRQMERELERVYAKSLTRIVKKPASQPLDMLPLWIACPDYPVPKGDEKRQSVRDVTVNDGRHMHAIAVVPPWSRVEEGLANHFDEKQSLYVTEDSTLWRIHAEPITHNPKRVNDYVLKALKRSRVGAEEVVILPRTRREVRKKPKK